MSNQSFHNKWHAFNHHTLPTPGYPDSSTDPIASFDYPFQGIFYSNNGEFGRTLTDINVRLLGQGYLAPPIITLLPTGSGVVYRQPEVFTEINTSTGQLTSIKLLKGGIFLPPVLARVEPTSGENPTLTATVTFSADKFFRVSDSFGWAFYTNITRTYSGEWWLYPSVETTVTRLSTNWNLGYLGYTVLQANSAVYYDNVHTCTYSISSEKAYDGRGGTGWSISLSSITHRTNVGGNNQIDIKQKVATPVQLTENPDKTITWNTTAQTVYFSVTGNYVLSAIDVINAKKGGRYVAWFYVDGCPENDANVYFHPNTYSLFVKQANGGYSSANNVISLSANTITKLDLLYTGTRMIGKATRYFEFLPTTDDIYFRGLGLSFISTRTRRNINPVYINNTQETGIDPRYLQSKTEIPPRSNYPLPYHSFDFNILPDSTPFTATSSLLVPNTNLKFIQNTKVYRGSTYNINTGAQSFSILDGIPGESVRFRFLLSNLNYISYNLINAVWPTQFDILQTPGLTASFDRVVSFLSGDWTQQQNAIDLVATPLSADAPPIITQIYKNNFYNLAPEAIVPLTKCFPDYKIEIASGKDREIQSILINDAIAGKNYEIVNGKPIPFSFLNEEKSYLNFFRIQDDFTIDVTYRVQLPKSINNLFLWFNPMDNSLVNNTVDVRVVPNTVLLSSFKSSVNSINSLTASSINRPSIKTDTNIRFIEFTNGTRLTTNRPLTTLQFSNNDPLSGIYFRPFTTFTLLSTTNSTINHNTSSIIWWLGDYKPGNSKKGLGLVLSGDKIFYINDSFLDTRLSTVVQKISANKFYLITTSINYNGIQPRITLFSNGVAKLRNKNLGPFTNRDPIENFNLNFNTQPNSAVSLANYKLMDFLMYDRELRIEELRSLNSYLLRRMDEYK